MKKELLDFYFSLDRSLFVPEKMRDSAHIDAPLPIGYEQTISQPSLVLKMTALLELTPQCRILEIGTGSGYQTAFLSRFCASVYTVERISELSQSARERLSQMGYLNITYRIGDGSMGWPEFAPFERIIVTAAPERMPERLIEQLASGGRMIAPVGPFGDQKLFLIQKNHRGKVTMQPLFAVAFVEMKGPYGRNSHVPGCD